jgi:hypothetical protein
MTSIMAAILRANQPTISSMMPLMLAIRLVRAGTPLKIWARSSANIPSLLARLVGSTEPSLLNYRRGKRNVLIVAMRDNQHIRKPQRRENALCRASMTFSQKTRHSLVEAQPSERGLFVKSRPKKVAEFHR